MGADVRPLDDLHGRLCDALDAAAEAQAALQDAYRQLAAGFDPLRVVEVQVPELRGLRDRATAEVGRLVLAWVLRGGGVVLEDGEAPLADADVEAPLDRAVEDVAPAGPSSPPATAQSLLALASGLGPQWRDASVESGAFVGPLLARLGPPRAVRDRLALDGLVDRLAGVLDAASLDALPGAARSELLGLVVAWLRDIQGRLAALRRTDLRPRVDAAFPVFTAYVERHRPGYVFGLRRGDTPKHGTWLADARTLWRALGGEVEAPELVLARLRATLDDAPGAARVREAVEDALDQGLAATDTRLLDLLAPFERELKGSKRLKALRRGIRARRMGEVEATEDRGSALLAAWPLLPQTRGRRAVVLGGDQREGAMQRIREAFGFGDVSWEHGLGTRRVGALVERVRTGTVELVIILRQFISHSATDAVIGACKDVGTPFVLVDSGYGVSQVQLAMERYLSVPD